MGTPDNMISPQGLLLVRSEELMEMETMSTTYKANILPFILLLQSFIEILQNSN